MKSYAFGPLTVLAEGELPLPADTERSLGMTLRVTEQSFTLKAHDLVHDAGGLLWGKVEDGYGLRTGGIDFLYQGNTLAVNTKIETAADMVVRAALGFVVVAMGVCAFHGSSASLDGRALLIVGHKGAGKSTTVTGLVRRGWGLLCDDLVAVHQDRVYPTVLNTRLLSDSWNRLGGTAEVVPGMDGKRAWTFPAATPAQLIGAVILRPGRLFDVEGITGHRKLQLLVPHLNNLEGVGDPRLRLADATDLAARLRVCVMTRPVDRFALDEVLNAVEGFISKES